MKTKHAMEIFSDSIPSLGLAECKELSSHLNWLKEVNIQYYPDVVKAEIYIPSLMNNCYQLVVDKSNLQRFVGFSVNRQNSSPLLSSYLLRRILHYRSSSLMLLNQAFREVDFPMELI